VLLTDVGKQRAHPDQVVGPTYLGVLERCGADQRLRAELLGAERETPLKEVACGQIGLRVGRIQVSENPSPTAGEIKNAGDGVAFRC
jgi:hypothetical protein